MLRKIEGRRSMERQRMRWLDGIIDSMDMHLSKRREIVCRSPWGHKEWVATKQLNKIIPDSVVDWQIMLLK